jgi:hypothetical protein
LLRLEIGLEIALEVKLKIGLGIQVWEGNPHPLLLSHISEHLGLELGIGRVDDRVRGQERGKVRIRIRDWIRGEVLSRVRDG